MSSLLLGTATLDSEVTNITNHGFWLLVADHEYFVPFADYPAFQTATVAQIYAMRQSGPDQLHWPELDIDIELSALAQPEQFPLKFQSAAA